MIEKLEDLKRKSTGHISLNIGYTCNQSCYHCHLEAGPDRYEMINLKTIHKLASFLKDIKPNSLEITGGAPELCPHLYELINKTRPLIKKMSLRTNLTILDEEKYFPLIRYFYENEIELIASLPCYTAETVDKQRGSNVFRKSITILQKLNEQGYGKDMELSLAYNPSGPVLAGGQSMLEKDFKRSLNEKYGVSFSRLLILTNFPLGRFASLLKKDERYDQYIQLLKENFNPCVMDQLMCLNQVTINWKGDFYDCDFNMALDTPKEGFSNLDHYRTVKILGRKIDINEHCLACTAGQGTSCHGALEKE